jgi:hypothetical protein
MRPVGSSIAKGASPLLDENADIMIQNQENLTAVHIARKFRYFVSALLFNNKSSIHFWIQFVICISIAIKRRLEAKIVVGSNNI